MLETYQAYTGFLQRESKIRQIALQPSTRIEKLVEAAARQEQARALAQIQETPAPAAPTAPSSVIEESVGGAVPIGSPYYIERAEDGLVYAALAQPGSTILIKGPRQIGKSSLLARALHHARQQGACILLTDWQNLAHAELENAETFFLSLAHSLTDQLDLDGSPEEAFLPKRPLSANFERFLRRQVFANVDKPVVWGIDEADRLFACDFCDDVFGKFRAWHNERALDPEGPWRRFSLVLAYSTEANLFIKNVNQSPFNVGTRVALRDLNIEQVGELNRRYGSPLSDEDVTRLYRLVGGHPYLARRCLHALQHQQADLDTIEATADQEGGLFTDHLERRRFALLLDKELTEAVRQWLRGESAPSQASFARLCAAGMMAGASPSEMQPRCQLYARYLKRELL
ncbi:MAG TPA: AAA-like domain-containing protein [Chthonomonadaceae bacterium]|nr:AAA-like domain-containing protein [Chthonomonadaceae bacterium]